MLVGALVVPHEKTVFLNFPRPCSLLWTVMRTVCTRSASRDERRGSRALTDSCCLACTITKIICQSISPDWSLLFLFNQYLSFSKTCSFLPSFLCAVHRCAFSGPVQLNYVQIYTEIGVQKKKSFYIKAIFTYYKSLKKTLSREKMNRNPYEAGELEQFQQ